MTLVVRSTRYMVIEEGFMLVHLKPPDKNRVSMQQADISAFMNEGMLFS